MTLIKRRGFDLLPEMRSSWPDLFNIDRFFSEPSPFVRVPATNIRETDDEFIVELAAPGMTKGDFHVGIENNILEIKSEKEEESKEEKEQYTRREYDYTSFYRSFDLPQTVETDQIKAEYEDGILRIHLPKVAEAKKRPAKAIEVA